MGDIQPMLALAVELSRVGHDVVLALSPNYRARTESLGLDFVPIGPAMQMADVRSIITSQTSMPEAANQAHHFVAAMAPSIPEIYRALRHCCADSDLLISTAHHIAGRMVHDATGIPFATVHLSHFGALGGRDLKSATAPLINKYRLMEGLERLDDPLTRDAMSPQLALYAVTSRILKRPSKWPEHHHVTGYFFLDEEGWQPSDGLVEFLSDGGCPVVFTFGSMMHDDTAHLSDIIYKTIRRTGIRGIVMGGWSGLGRELPPCDEIHQLTEFVPHSWLFERVAAVVHHGGAGTTAATLRAGVPTIVVPHILDQPIWGEFARALGCAGAVIAVGSLSEDNLTESLTITMTNPKYLAAAQREANYIANEHGVQTARRILEEFATQHNR